MSSYVLKIFTAIMIVIVLFSCEESEPQNLAPTISISAPSNYSEFIQGESITISVNAEDPEDDLDEVRFYVNNIGVGSDNTWPYQYVWDSGSYQTGNYTLKAIAIDGGGLESESTVNIELQDPAAWALNGMAYYQPEDGSFDIIGMHEDGAIIAINQLSDGSGEVTYLAEEGGPAFHVWADVNGLPTQAYINGHFLLFSNYTATTVDVALVTNDGTIEIQRGLNVADILNQSRGYTLSKTADASDWLRWGGHALSVGGCVASLAAAGWTFGALAPLAAWGCGAAAVGIIAEFLPEDLGIIGTTGTAVSSFAGALGCIGGQVYNCWLAIGGAIATIGGNIETDEENLDSEIVLAEGALESGSGDVQITLTWDTAADLDLWVTDPAGERIYFANSTSVSGGWLDVDDMNGYGPENIYWPTNGAPSGTYIVQVNHWSGASPTNYSVLVQAFGQMQVYDGTIYDNQTVDVVTFSSYGSLPLISQPIISYTVNEGQTK